MKRLLKLKYGILFAMTLFLLSCESEDFTGYSTLVPTAPTLTVSGVPASINFTETDSVFSFTVTLSVAQIVDVPIYIKQIAGTATLGEDFTIMNDGSRLIIPTGSTTGTVKIKVLIDELIEETETFTLQLGDERTSNATIVPVNVPFTIGNYTSNVLLAQMSWTTDVLAEVGVDLTPTEVADLRMLIVDSNGDIVDVADGAAFEEWDGFDALADGDYRIATDIYSTLNFGDINKVLNFDITLEFNQDGVINSEVLSFSKVMTNANPCDLYRTYLAKITKSGNTYTIVKEVSVMTPEILVWQGEDATYPSEIETTLDCFNQTMTGLNFGWMLDWWGEVIVSGGTLVYTNPTATTIDIPLQKYCKTTYNGAPQTEYYIQGTGTIDNSGTYPVWTIHYELVQGGTLIGNLCFLNYGWDTDGFDAVITTDPAGKKVISQTVPKPVRK